MDALLILRLITYVTAGTIVVVGILLLTGLFIPVYVPANFRIITGVLMLLYGSYRIIMLIVKNRNERSYEE